MWRIVKELFSWTTAIRGHHLELRHTMSGIETPATTIFLSLFQVLLLGNKSSISQIAFRQKEN